MNEKYVTDLETSKRLKDVGIKQESENFFKCYTSNDDRTYSYEPEEGSIECDDDIARFHLSELKGIASRLLEHKWGGKVNWYLCLSTFHTWTTHNIDKTVGTEIQSLSEFVIYLKEQKK